MRSLQVVVLTVRSFSYSCRTLVAKSIVDLRCCSLGQMHEQEGDVAAMWHL